MLVKGLVVEPGGFEPPTFAMRMLGLISLIYAFEAKLSLLHHLSTSRFTLNVPVIRFRSLAIR